MQYTVLIGKKLWMKIILCCTFPSEESILLVKHCLQYKLRYNLHTKFRGVTKHKEKKKIANFHLYLSAQHKFNIHRKLLNYSKTCTPIYWKFNKWCFCLTTLTQNKSIKAATSVFIFSPLSLSTVFTKCFLLEQLKQVAGILSKRQGSQMWYILLHHCIQFASRPAFFEQL